MGVHDDSDWLMLFGGKKKQSLQERHDQTELEVQIVFILDVSDFLQFVDRWNSWNCEILQQNTLRGG